MRSETIKKLANNAKKYAGQFDYIGIRVQNSDYGKKSGDSLDHESSVWVDGDDTGDMLNGVSAIDIDLVGQLPEFVEYSGDVALVLGCDRASMGEDDAEIVMRDAVIIEVIKK